MTDRKKVFDALRNCVTEPKCKDCPWEDCEKIGCKRTKVPVTLLLDTLNLLKEQPQWISVEDRLPDKQPCEYLVVNANNVETAICLDNRWITPRRVTKITHWMPLPEPPEVKQNG